MVFNGKSSDKKGSMENAHPSLLDSFGLGSGEVEVFPEGQQVTDSTGKTLAARDSLALQESGGVIKEEEHSDEFSVVDENSLDDDAISADSRGGSRRKILRIALLSALVLAIVLGTVLTRNKRGKSRYVEPGIVSGAQLDSNVAPTSLPSQSPTSVLESTMEYQLLAPYVNPPSKLLDPESPQGKAFTQILSEQTSEEFEFRVKQRFAMMVVFFAMGGEDWSWQKGWSDFSEDECDWHGVAICRFRDGHRIVAGLRLSSNNAVGGVPEEICLLEDLETLVFEGNQLGGELPECLTSLSSVFEFNVHNNAFSGRPPSGFFNMPRLETLDLSSNMFTGRLDFLVGPDDRSETVGNSRLTTLRLDNNGFDGELPSELYALDALQELTLHDTAVQGDVSAMCENPTVSILTTDCSQAVCNKDCCDCL